MDILSWIVFGLIVGIIAKFLLPGRDPGGLIITVLLGIGGSFVGGWLTTVILGDPTRTSGWIGSVIGAMAILVLYRVVLGRKG